MRSLDRLVLSSAHIYTQKGAPAAGQAWEDREREGRGGAGDMEMQCLRLQTDRNRQHVRQAQSGQNEKLSNAVSPLCKTTHMLPVPVRLWSEHAFHIPRASPSLPLPHPPVPARRLGRLSSALKKNSGVIDKGVGIMVY